jgi:2-keto-4-pentenoate hydratase/2-oxohepta-3-ene-1,7-dioic acid hydratase in catechol pathway
MRLVSFRVSDRDSYGVGVGDGVIDMGRRLRGQYPTLRAAIGADALAEFALAAEATPPDYPLSQVTLGTPIPEPDKIVCIGRNYKGHALNARDRVPDHPSLFLRLSNTLVPHGAALVRPRVSTDMDYEGELALIIGKPGRHIPRAQALQHVVGYSCFNDGSIRDFQFKHSVTAGKNFASTGSFGPWVVTSDEIPDPTQLSLSTRLNGTTVQQGKIADMIFDISSIIAYVSAFTPLVAGDVIATGTPEGAGFSREPPVWMKPGDVIEVEISGIGVLRNTVVAECA